MVKINDAISKNILEVLENHKLIELYPKGKKGICYKITRKGACTYKNVREAYHNVGIELDGAVQVYTST